jgi:aspartyl-tRNA(Asn)/glutamyl-tRNA(Gln) amidotransferase subunit A
MTDDACFLTIAGAADLIRTRKLSPVELTRALIDRTERLDPQIRAFITPTPELALTQAGRAESEIGGGHYRGPLHGIPFGLKDIFNTAGILTSAHSKICRENVPDEDATATARLYEAGGVLMGKLATHEFAHGGPSHDLPWPLPRNPWNLEHFVGGSSSGSAAAIASGFVLGALGSDTGGSIRGPAALAGVVGLKPTAGLVSRHGVIPNSFTFDHCGPMTWTVEDCAILLKAIAGYDVRDPSSACRAIPDYRAALREDLRGIRVGVIRHFWEEDAPASPDLCRSMDEAIDVLHQLGATIETVRLRPLGEYYDVRNVIAQTELFSIHQQDLMERPGDFGADFLRRVLPGCLFQAAHYVQAQRERRIMLQQAEPLYRKYDVLLTAGTGPAPRLDQIRNIDFWKKPNIYYAFSIMGGPALALCNGFSESGLPLGMQIAGAPFAEETVLRVGHAYEKATAWREARPRLIEGAVPAPVTPAPTPPGPDVDVPTRQLIESLARRAGLTLGEREHALLCEAAPYALAMAQRIRRNHPRFAEPASTFVRALRS